MRLLGTLTTAGILLLATAPAASADLDFTPEPFPFQSEVGKPAQPQAFRVSATCARMFGFYCTPDTVTVSPSITPGSGGDFGVGASTCPPTIHNNGTPDPHESCVISVTFTPRAVGTSTATLNVGSGANGTVTKDLVGTGTPSTRAATQGVAAKKRGCGKLKKKSARKKCRAKRKANRAG